MVVAKKRDSSRGPVLLEQHDEADASMKKTCDGGSFFDEEKGLSISENGDDGDGEEEGSGEEESDDAVEEGHEEEKR